MNKADRNYACDAAKLAIFWMLLMVVPPSAQADKYSTSGIKGVDDREIVNPSEYPWSAIGRINKGSGFCTGALIGPRTVLTAAHCLWNKKTNRFYSPQSLYFVAGYEKGSYAAYSVAADIMVSKAYVFDKNNGLKQARNDWAVLTLKENLGDIVGYFGLSGFDATTMVKGGKRKGGKRKNRARQVVVRAGYSRDRQYAMTAHINCDVLGPVNGLIVLAHLCDAIGGDSGSPFFVYQNGEFQIVAIHVATSTNRNGAVGIAIPVNIFADQLKSQIPSGGATDSGEHRPAVETARLLLKRRGYQFDNDRDAITAFQREKGLAMTGKVTVDLLGHLVSSMNDP